MHTPFPTPPPESFVPTGCTAEITVKTALETNIVRFRIVPVPQRVKSLGDRIAFGPAHITHVVGKRGCGKSETIRKMISAQFRGDNVRFFAWSFDMLTPFRPIVNLKRGDDHMLAFALEAIVEQQKKDPSDPLLIVLDDADELVRNKGVADVLNPLYFNARPLNIFIVVATQLGTECAIKQCELVDRAILFSNVENFEQTRVLSRLNDTERSRVDRLLELGAVVIDY